MDDEGVDVRFVRRAVRTLIVPLTALAVTLAAGWWAGGRLAPDARTSLASALDALPASVAVAGVTDWRQIRAQVGIDDAGLRDLTSRSVLAGSIDEMAGPYGWSAADLDWEAYGQSNRGGVLVARLSDEVAPARVERGLSAIGYRRSGDVWSLDAEGRARVGPELASALGAVAIVSRQRLIVAGSAVGDVRRGLASVQHDGRSLLDRRPVAELADELVGASSVLVQSGATACESSAVGATDPDVAAQAAVAVERAGRLVKPRFAGRGLFDDGERQDIAFVAAFGSSAQAARQARVRGALATGPFIGRSGLVQDSLALMSSTARGAVTSLWFEVDPDLGAYMSGEGPVLFASCP